MASNVSVSISGPALSFLIYENVKCSSDQKGFLLGDVVNHVTQSISDSQIHNEKMETVIRVTCVLPIPKSASFYNGTGKIDKEKLGAFLKDKQMSQVVGWYSFRRNCSIQPTFLNKLLHREMCAALDHISPDFVAMCLLNTSAPGMHSTHAFNHKFVRYCNSKFEALPAQVHNLGLTEQTEYRVSVSGTCESDSFTNIVKTAVTNMNGRADVTTASSIHKDLQDHLRNLIDQVALSESQIDELEQEVNLLREHSGPLSNEILLPKLLQESLSTATPTSSATVSRNTSSQIRESISSASQSGNGETVATKVDVSVPATVWSPSLANNVSVLQSARSLNLIESARSSTEKENTPSDPFGYVRTEMMEMSLPHAKSPVLQAGDGKRGGNTRSAGRGIRRLPATDDVAINSVTAAPSPRGYAQAVKKPGNMPEVTQTAALRSTGANASTTNGSRD